MKFPWPLRSLVIIALVLAGAEVGSRLDDWYHFGTPFFSTPSREFDLTYREPWGLRGKSNGLYRKWRLNEFGFRGDEITLHPSSKKRIFVLGSSETFGVFEQPGHEYPALLNARCKRENSWEIVNVSMAGMATNRAIAYWSNWPCNQSCVS